MTDHKQNWIDLFNKLDELTRKPTQYIPSFTAHEIMNIMLEMDKETLRRMRNENQTEEES